MYCKLPDPPDKENEESYAEKSQGKLDPDSPVGAHSEGHTGILHENQLEPAAEHGHRHPGNHLHLDRHLDDLVDNDEKHSQENEPEALDSAFAHYLPPFFLLSISLASMVRVA